MKDAKGHGSNARGSHQGGVDAIGRSFDSLPPETKLDIAHALMESVPALNEFAQGRVEDVQAVLDGAVPTLNVGYKTVDPATIDISNRSVSKTAVEKYAAMSSSPPPIVMSGRKLIEGGHRVAAGQKTGRKLGAADISGLLKMNWKDWLNGGKG